MPPKLVSRVSQLRTSRVVSSNAVASGERQNRGVESAFVIIMKNFAIAVAAGLCAGIAGMAVAAPVHTIEGARDIQAYQNAAGSDVPQMPATSLVNWQALDDQSLAVWTASDKPWLVRVEQPCDGLTQTDSVAMTSTAGNVVAGTDAVEVGGAHCKIASIQPVDYAKVASMRGEMRHHRIHARTARAATAPKDVKAPSGA